MPAEWQSHLWNVRKYWGSIVTTHPSVCEHWGSMLMMRPLAWEGWGSTLTTHPTVLDRAHLCHVSWAEAHGEGQYHLESGGCRQ